MSHFLDAIHCNNHSGKPPVWLMRQAGRYMPEYRAIREKTSTDAMFHDPDIATEVTLLPEKLLDVDALVLFSDILVLCEIFGKKVEFIEGVGPVITPQITTEKDIHNLIQRPLEETVDYVRQTVENVKQASDLPLLGFCGAPFTVATYMIGSLEKAEAFASDHPRAFHDLLNKLCIAAIDHLKMQVDAGAQAVQIFDSWAGMTSYTGFLQYSHIYLQRIVDAMRDINVPTIVFSRNSSLYPRELSHLNPNCISFDWKYSMKELRQKVPPHIAIQGNINPEILRDESPQFIEKVTKQLLEEVGSEPGFIANLGHGVLPKTPVANITTFISTIKNGVFCESRR